MNKIESVRITLTLVLIYLSYLETGMATAVCLTLISLSIELQQKPPKK